MSGHLIQTISHGPSIARNTAPSETFENHAPMKTKSFNSIAVATLTALTVLAPAVGSASLLLAGFNNIDNGLVNEVILEDSVAGFQGKLVKTTASFTTGGSSDQTYGASTLKTPPANNGFVVSDFSVTFTNSTTQNYALESLLFDAVATTGETVSLTYSVNSGPLPAATIFSPILKVGNASNTQQNYGDYALALNTINLSVGSSITFFFNDSKGGARFDNIALTGNLSAVPEPTSVLGLAGLIGGGFFLRTRRRTQAA